MTGDERDERPAGDEDDTATGIDRTTDRSDDPSTTRPMNDAEADATETGEPTAAGEPNGEPNGGASDRSTDGVTGRLPTDRLRGILDRVGLTALILLALVAGWSVYRQTGVAIRTWLDPAYQPIALAAFNLAILFIALAGVAHQVSRIRASE